MVEEYTADQIAKLFANATGCVDIINAGKPSWQPEEAWKEAVKRNWQHLELIKGYKKEVDGESVSIWTTENFTAIDAAIDAGKAIQA